MVKFNWVDIFEERDFIGIFFNVCNLVKFRIEFICFNIFWWENFNIIL